MTTLNIFSCNVLILPVSRPIKPQMKPHSFTTIRLNVELKVKTHQEIVTKVQEIVTTVQEQTNAATSLLLWNTADTTYGDMLGLQQLHGHSDPEEIH